MRARVWAPDAASVQLHAGPQGQSLRVDMEREDDPHRPGWWEGPEIAPGTDYAYAVDGEGPFPDPRSAWQPYGVHGYSRVFDAAAHEWTDDRWRGRDARGALTYELHVGTFTTIGTLDSASRRLEELASIGIDMVELMPIVPFPGRYGWGYDGVSPYAVHEGYGGPAALQRFVDQAHGAGIGVCLDVVYNHLGPSGNYLAPFGPYFTDAHETPWGWAVNLDQPDSAEVRRYFVENALRWFRDFHVDALRLDAVHQLRDNSDRPFLAELADAVAALETYEGRPLSLVAESDLNDDRMVTPTAKGGLGMRAQWDDDVHHALHAYLTGERHGYYVDFGSIEALDKAYREVFWHDGTYSPFRDREWGRPVAAARDRREFVVCASNHDQVGNRALGDRPSATLSPGAQATSLAFILLSPFTPLVFMGEEYGETRPFLFFTDYDDPDLARAVREGRAAEFAGHGWSDLYGHAIQVPDPQDPATARNSIVSPASALGPPHDLLRAWFADLVAARVKSRPKAAWRRHPAGVSERSPRVVTMHGPVAVHANLSPEPAAFPGLAPLATFGQVEVGTTGATLPPDTVALEWVDQRRSRGRDGRRSRKARGDA